MNDTLDTQTKHTPRKGDHYVQLRITEEAVKRYTPPQLRKVMERTFEGAMHDAYFNITRKHWPA